jgi:hypothetical protein
MNAADTRTKLIEACGWALRWLKILCNGYVTTIASWIFKQLITNIFLCNGHLTT